MTAPLPANAASSNGHNPKADKLRPDMFKLSATVQTRTSDDSSLARTGNYHKTPNWFAGKESKRGNPDNDNESERSLRVKSSRNSEEDNMHIMVSKSFFITDEERGSIMSRDRGGSYR